MMNLFITSTINAFVLVGMYLVCCHFELVRAGLAKYSLFGRRGRQDGGRRGVRPESWELWNYSEEQFTSSYPRNTHNDAIACLRTLLFRFAHDGSVSILGKRLFVSFPIIAHAKWWTQL